MAHVDAAPVRAAQVLPGGAQDDRDMGDRERSGAIVEGGLVTKKWISDPIHKLVLQMKLEGKVATSARVESNRVPRF